MTPILHDPVFVPTTDEKLQIMLELAHVKPGQKVADLGSGNGKIIIALAKLGVEGHGYEINYFLVWQSRHTIRRLGLEKLAKVHRQSFRQADLSSIDLVTLYTSAETMAGFEKKLQKELKSGAKVVSNTFQFPNWKPLKVRDRVYLYQK